MNHTELDRWLLILTLLILAGVGFFGWQHVADLKGEISAREATLSEIRDALGDTKEEASSTAARAEKLGDQIRKLQNDLQEAEEENDDLEDDLEDAEDMNEEFEERIEELGETVGDISRYTSVDPELLKKYSRVYFLSENYTPESLEEIDSEWLAEGKVELEFHAEAYGELEDMLEDAEDDGVDLRIVSAYRSFQTQQILNDSYQVTYGEGANQFSAEQGYSEHQLGTTVDFTTPELGNSLTQQFDQTESFEWLEDNAHEYGFVLSYPEGNRFYTYEPWHWRFVGVELAEDLDDDGASFYDWSQREIDEYRGELFQG